MATSAHLKTCRPLFTSFPEWNSTTGSSDMLSVLRVWLLIGLYPLHLYLSISIHTKGFISNCYGMLLPSYLGGYPCNAKDKWEQDVGPLKDGLWDIALDSVLYSSPNEAQRLSQLYIVSWAHYTPLWLHCIGNLQTPLSARCITRTGDLIHLLWSCPKLLHYWTEVINTINSVFHITIPLEPTRCLLDDLQLMKLQVVAVNKALFQARKLLLQLRKSQRAPTHKEWVLNMGHTLPLKKVFFHHRGSPNKFDRYGEIGWTCQALLLWNLFGIGS